MSELQGIIVFKVSFKWLRRRGRLGFLSKASLEVVWNFKMTRYVCDLTHQLGFPLSRPNPIRQVRDNMDMSDSD
jgi:hypothetical protein